MAKSMMHVRGNAALIANIYSGDAAVLAGMQRATRVTMKDVYEMAFMDAPRDTNWMADHIRYEISANELAFSVYLDPSDFVGITNPINGKIMPFYPPWVEFGEMGRPAQPFLWPAYAVHEPIYKARIGSEAKRAIRRMRRER